MATRNINDYLNSGEVNRIKVTDNIQFVKADVPEAEGMFARFGTDGLLTGYRAKDQDVHWTDTNAEDITLSSTLNIQMSVTIDQDVSPEDGTYTISFTASNTDKKTKDCVVHIFDDGVEVATQTVGVTGESDKIPYVFSGSLSDPYASGSVITCGFTGEAEVTINGSVSVSTLEIIKAESAPIASLTFNELSYDLDKRSNLVMTDTWQTIAEVVTKEKAVIGAEYEIGFSIASTYDQITKSEMFQISYDGGSTWMDFSEEPKDKTNITPRAFINVTDAITVAEKKHVILQAKKETSTGIMKIIRSLVWVKRVI